MTFKADNPVIRACVAVSLLLVSACDDDGRDVAPIDRARGALANGDGVQAEVILLDMLSTGASKADLAAYLGEAELQQGQTAEARKWLASGEFSKETASHGFHMLARLEIAEGNLPAAGAAFDKALAEERKNPELWVDIARMRYRGGEQRQAVEASNYAVEIDPENPDALKLRGELVRDSEGLVAALPWFEEALEVHPDNVDLLYDYAATLGEIGEAKEMLRVVRRIAELAPDNKRIFYLQAVLAARAEQWELARSLLLRTSQDMQDTPAGMLLSGVIDIENGNYASAAQTLGVLATSQPDNLRVQNLFARALALGGNQKEIIYHFENFARSPSASPYLLTLVGRAFEVLDERDKAAYFLDRAATPRSGNLIAMPAVTDPENLVARGTGIGPDALQSARARIAAGNPAVAGDAVFPFLEKFPGSSDALSLAGDAALADRQFKTALERYQAATSVKRPWVTTRKMIKAYQGAGMNNEALELLQSYFEGDPGNVEAAGMMGVFAIDRKDWALAQAYLDHALDNGGYRDTLLLSLRARVALELNDPQGAVDAAEAAYAIQPLNPMATEALMLSYQALGQHQAHVEVLSRKLQRLRR